VGCSLSPSTHLAPHHITRFPDLLPHARPGRLAGEDKHLVLLAPLYPAQLAAGAVIRAGAGTVGTSRPT